MTKKRTIHEAVFRLSYDLGLQISPQLQDLKVKLAPQQLRAMRQIWSDKETTLLELSKTLKRDKGQVTRLIDDLCALSMVERIPNPNDGRSKVLRLTNDGLQFFENIENIEAQFSKQLTKGISKEQLDVFFQVSDHLSKNLRELD